MDTVAKCFKPSGESTATTTAAVAATAVVGTLAAVSLSRFTLWPRQPQIISGALTTSIPRLTKEEVAKVAYQPDHFPGARDVVTPYGNIRVYEFGPEQGRKVLFIHGISTSCMTLSDMAGALADKGCRVMLFDLFGRGFSDAPGDLPYDTRLFVSQVLLVLASSPLPWTGRDAFSLIGYSLGGGIAANFAATFPEMVASLVLLSPSGLIRPENIGRLSRLIFTSGLVPERLLAWITKSRLRSPIDNAVSKRRPATTPTTAAAAAASAVASSIEGDKEDFVDVAVQDAVDPPAQQQAQEQTVVSPTTFELQVTEFVRWSIDHNHGFVPAMMSTIRHAPLMEQQPYWRKLATRRPGTTAVLIGQDDTLIQHEDYEVDALPLIGGREHAFWRLVPGAHNFPFTHPQTALEALYEFWGMDK